MRRLGLLGVAAVAIVAGCSGGGSSTASVTLPDTVVISTLPPGTTPVPGSDLPTTAPDTVPTGPTYPLTGLPVTDPIAAARPALVVKIDNHPLARPQTGLGVADIVFEENVEGITRFAAVFQSQGSDPVGPIRSGRTQDIILLGSLDHPLFAWSGGNATVTKAIASSDFVNLSAQILTAYKGGGFYRSNDRKAPHDLFAQTTSLWSLAPVGAAAPPPQFEYRAAGTTPIGDPSTGLRIDMDGVRIDWTYSASSDAYLRDQNGDPHTDAVSGPISAANVVVLVVRYQPSAADSRSPEAQTTGSGDLFVLTDGVLVRGTWSRADRTAPFTLRDTSGTTIELTPGRTWVELARDGATTPNAG